MSIDADVEVPLLGENVRFSIRLVETPPSKGHSIARMRQLSEKMVEVKTFSKMSDAVSVSDSTMNLFVDKVINDDEMAPDVAATLMPVAQSIFGRCNHATIVCSKSNQLDSAHTFFDPDARQCFGLQVILAISAEARKAGKHCALSFGLVEETLATAVDLLAVGDDGRSTQPVRARYRPSIFDGTIFAGLTEIDLNKDQRPQTVLRAGVEQLRRHQEKQQCIGFAVVTVGTGETAHRLYIVDIANPQHLKYAINNYDLVSSPMADNDTVSRPELMLPLLVFGVCARARTAIVFNVPTACGTEDVSCTKAFVKARSLVVYPSDQAVSADGTTVFAHMQAAEIHVLRSQINYYAAKARNATLKDALAQDLHECMADLRTCRDLLANKITKIADPKERSRDAAGIVLKGRLGLLGLLEQEVAQREAGLNEYHQWLLSLRVIEPHSVGESILYTERARLLEHTIETQQEELDRIRRLVSRDMNVLRAEFGVLRQAIEAKTPLECVFRNSLEKFAQETALIAQGDDPVLAYKKCKLAVQELHEKLTHDSDLFFGATGAGGQDLESAACEALFRASVDNLRRTLGMTIEPPIKFVDHAESFWSECVTAQYTARADRYKMRCLASGLVMNCDKLADAVDSCMQHLETFMGIALETHRKSREREMNGASSNAREEMQSPIQRARNMVLAELNNTNPATLRSDGYFKIEQKKLIDSAAALKLRVAGCQGVVEALRCAASAVEASLMTGKGDELTENAQDVAEYILHRYDRPRMTPNLSSAAMLLESPDADTDGGPRMVVRLDEVVSAADVSKRSNLQQRGLRTQAIRQGVFSALVRDAAATQRTSTSSRNLGSSPAAAQRAATPTAARAATPTGGRRPSTTTNNNTVTSPPGTRR